LVQILLSTVFISIKTTACKFTQATNLWRCRKWCFYKTWGPSVQPSLNCASSRF